MNQAKVFADIYQKVMMDNPDDWVNFHQRHNVIEITHGRIHDGVRERAIERIVIHPDGTVTTHYQI